MLGLDQMAIQAKLKVVKHKLYTLYNEYVKLFSKEATCNVASSQTS